MKSKSALLASASLWVGAAMTWPAAASVLFDNGAAITSSNYCDQQNGQCLVCSQPLTLAEGWHVHHLLWRAFGGDDNIDNLVLLHPNCHRQLHSEGLVVEKFASREGRS